MNSTEPPVEVAIEAGANLEEAIRVVITIGGLGTLQLFRHPGEYFRADSWSGNINSRSLSGIQGFINVLRQVDNEVNIHS